MREPRKRRTKGRAGLSERAYAAHAGVSRGCVQKARSSGRLVLHPDGSIDAAASDARRAQATNPAMRRGRHQVSSRAVPQAALDAIVGGLRGQGAPPETAGSMSYLEARAANEMLRIEERRIRVQKLKGELVDRAKATDLVFRLARQERDAWTTWPVRVAALMAAELGVNMHQMQEVLSRYVRKHLFELADIEPDFR